MPSKGKVLIVDDDHDIRGWLSKILDYEGYQTTVAIEGRQAVAQAAEERPDVVLLDIKMPGMDGIDVLRHLLKMDPELPVIMITGHGTKSEAFAAGNIGAFHFIEKPPDRDYVVFMVRNAITRRRLASEKSEAEAALTKGFTLVGESEAMKQMAGEIERAAPTSVSVLITGENGAGKGVVARAVHRKSKRAAGPFVEVICAAIPDDLVESELFGHEKGAFTGASAMKPGRFEMADGGTIFLDEIGDMSDRLQAKVLRVIEGREFERVGGTETLRVDVRIIAATNKDLRRLMEEGKFREDLYWRLSQYPIHVPPLRSRREDIPHLARYFLGVYCEMYGLGPKTIEEAALRVLQGHSWPGNVRELRNTIERMVITSPSETLTVNDLPPFGESAQGGRADPSAAATYDDFRRLSEKQFLEAKLKENNWNISKTASHLGMQRSNLYKKMEKLGIAVPGKG